MNSLLNTRTWVLIISCITTLKTVAQDITTDISEPPNTSFKSSTQKSLSFSLSVLSPTAIDNSNFAKGSKERLGFEIGAQVFIYKGLFLGLFHSSTYFEITNQNLLGRYDKTSVAAVYLKLGYELEIIRNFSATLAIAPIGNVRYKNIIDRDRIKQQIDDADIMIYEVALAWQFTKTISAFFQYAYRIDNTKIQTAAEISDDFDRIDYQNLGLGLKFSLGDKPLLR